MEKSVNLTPEDLAARWHMSVNTLKVWRSQKKGVSYNKHGDRVTYALADIEEYERKNKVIIPVD